MFENLQSFLEIKDCKYEILRLMILKDNMAKFFIFMDEYNFQNNINLISLYNFIITKTIQTNLKIYKILQFFNLKIRIIRKYDKIILFNECIFYLYKYESIWCKFHVKNSILLILKT